MNGNHELKRMWGRSHALPSAALDGVRKLVLAAREAVSDVVVKGLRLRSILDQFKDVK